MDLLKIPTPEISIASPGRINLIGEHIDYNGGHVLPAAINLKLKLTFEKSNTNMVSVFSKDLEQSFQFDIEETERSTTEWHNFFIGVVYYVRRKAPESVRGFNCIVESNIPFGAGVSSSAALECGIAKGLNLLFNIGLTDSEIIRLSRDAEHNFVGTKCGIMDQFAVVRGKKDFLIKLDCASLNYSYVPARFEPYILVLLNSNVAHNLASSEYNKRRQSCEKGMEIIRTHYPQYEHLAQVPLDILVKLKPKFTNSVYEKLVYVVEENNRTLASCDALEENKLQEFGELLFASHHGLQTQYEVSCPELDFLVEFAKSTEGVIGARMMGGGFGGCTINLVHKDIAEAFIKNTKIAYHKAFGLSLTPHYVATDNGVTSI